MKVTEVMNPAGFTDPPSRNHSMFVPLGSRQEVRLCFPEVEVTRVTLDLWARSHLDDGALHAFKEAGTQKHNEIR